MRFDSNGCMFAVLLVYAAIALIVVSQLLNVTLDGDVGDASLTTEGAQYLIYNRVPKTGSTTFMTLIEQLAQSNNFAWHTFPERPMPQFLLTHYLQSALVDKLLSMNAPAVIIRHTYYIDARQFAPNATIKFINTFRDPVELIVSGYYYYLNAHRFMKALRNQTIDESIANGSLDVINISLLPFFCGQQVRCLRDKDYALTKAIEHVEQNYVVIGLLEHVNESLAVFEHKLPRFFRGASSVFYADGTGIRRTSHSWNKGVNATSIKYLRSRLRHDYVFYEYLKHKLLAQFAEIQTTVS